MRHEHRVRQPPPEKCAVKARANEPKPPRVTLPEPESEAVADDEAPACEPPLLKKLRDPPPPPLDVDPRGAQSPLACGSGVPIPGDAIPDALGSQVPRGISAKAPPPTASVPISSSATWPERFTGGAAGIGAGLRLPNSFVGFSAMISRSSRRR